MKKIIFILISSIHIHANTLNINILYLEQIIKKPPVLSNIIKEPINSGLKGALLAIIDSNKSAKFLNQKYNLEKIVSSDEKKLMATFTQFINANNVFILLNVSNELFLKILKHPLADKALLINIANTDNIFREQLCKKNIIHTIPSNAMLYDALGQFLVKRNWKKWILIKGTHKKDKKISESIKRAARRFGVKIIDEKTWTSNADIRRKAQDEMPSFTQGSDYDVVITADFYGDFGEYLYFNTWLPRPVAGTQGLKPVAWHKVVESWGAAQLQKRFEKMAHRWMNSKDYAAWVAVRTIVTSISKTNVKDYKINLDFIYSSQFELGAYKGRKLSYRKFNGQLRQPIFLVHPKSVVSTSPQPGFLHQETDLDTLGISKYETECK